MRCAQSAFGRDFLGAWQQDPCATPQLPFVCWFVISGFYTTCLSHHQGADCASIPHRTHDLWSPTPRRVSAACDTERPRCCACAFICHVFHVPLRATLCSSAKLPRLRTDVHHGLWRSRTLFVPRCRGCGSCSVRGSLFASVASEPDRTTRVPTHLFD